jgi:Dolichyl-phosphate-mannose-protein mannosyltransferase
VVVIALTFAVYTWMYLATPAAQLPGADGHYNWLFARSLAYDGDFDFGNDYQACGDPFNWNHPTVTGRANNSYYVGPAVYLTPVIWLLHHVMHFANGAPPDWVAGCRGPLTKWALFMGVFLGALTVAFTYRCARRVTSDGVAALAAALFAWGSSLPGYATIWPHYGHVYEAFSVSVVLLLSVRAAEQPESMVRWLFTGLSLGVAVLQRPPGLLVGFVPAAFAFFAFRGQWKKLALALVLLAVPAFLVGVVPLSLLNKYLYASYSLSASKPPFYVNPSRSHPFLLLFAPRGGLLYWTPVAWLSLIGMWCGIRAQATRPFALGLAAAFLTTLFIAASPLDWEASSSFGARRLVSVVPVLAILAAMTLDRIKTWMHRRRGRATAALGAAVAAPVAFAILGSAVGNGVGKSTIEHPLTQEELYGMGTATTWFFLDRDVGDLAVLPAELAFSLRYGLPMNAFRDATRPWYSRDSRTMGFLSNLPSLHDPQFTKVQAGLAPGADGSRMVARRARIVFVAAWPFATGLTVDARSDTPVRVHVGSGRAFGRTVWYGDLDLPGGGTPTTTTVPIPPESFDSGLVELVFESDAAVGAGVVVRGVQLQDTGTYAKPAAYGM